MSSFNGCLTWILGFVVLVLVVGFFWVLQSGATIGNTFVNTYAAKHSYGYTTAKQEELESYVQDYHQKQTQIDAIQASAPRSDVGSTTTTIQDLQAEQQADVNKLRTETSTMNRADVPTDVQQLLDGQGG